MWGGFGSGAGDGDGDALALPLATRPSQLRLAGRPRHLHASQLISRASPAPASPAPPSQPAASDLAPIRGDQAALIL